jgi:succinoglycan biosynthesis protein ExoA
MSDSGSDLPTASIIIPILNQDEVLIRRCLESLIAQDYPMEKFEILVVDGSREKGIAEMLKELASKHEHMKIVANPHGSVIDAMKIGVAHATGEMILRGDVRILYMSDYIESCIHSSRKAFRILTGR